MTAVAVGDEGDAHVIPKGRGGTGSQEHEVVGRDQVKAWIGASVQGGTADVQHHSPIPSVQVISQVPLTHDHPDGRATRHAGKGRIIGKDERAFVRRALGVVVGDAPAAQVHPAGPRHPQLEPTLFPHSIVAKEHVARAGRVGGERLEARADRLRGVERQRDDRGLREVGRLPPGEAVARRGRGRDLDGDGLKVDPLPGQVWEQASVDGDVAGAVAGRLEGELRDATQPESLDQVTPDKVGTAAGKIAQLLDAGLPVGRAPNWTVS